MLLRISDYIPEVKDRYYIDDNGNLYTDNGTKQMKDSIKNGYVKNDLALVTGKHRHFFRHRLVMLCFSPRENSDKLQVNHIDGDKTNNKLENLEWCTNRENQLHAIKMGLKVALKGENNPASKLKEEDVMNIIVDLLNHVPYSVLTKKYNCSKSTISAIKNKRNWKYLTKDIVFD